MIFLYAGAPFRRNETVAHRQGSYLLEAENIFNNVLGHLLQLLEKLRKVTQAFIKSSGHETWGATRRQYQQQPETTFPEPKNPVVAGREILRRQQRRVGSYRS